MIHSPKTYSGLTAEKAIEIMSAFPVKQLEQIERLIGERSDKGKTYVRVDEVLHPYTVTELKKRGFKVIKIYDLFIFHSGYHIEWA